MSSPDLAKCFFSPVPSEETKLALMVGNAWPKNLLASSWYPINLINNSNTFVLDLIAMSTTMIRTKRFS